MCIGVFNISLPNLGLFLFWNAAAADEKELEPEKGQVGYCLGTTYLKFCKIGRGGLLNYRDDNAG